MSELHTDLCAPCPVLLQVGSMLGDSEMFSGGGDDGGAGADAGGGGEDWGDTNDWGDDDKI